MTEIHDNFLITVNIFLGSFHKKVIWAAGFEISIRLLLGLFRALFISIWGLHRIWGWGKLGREHVYDRTGHNPTCFPFLGGQCI